MFFEKFDQLADAPNAVVKMRELMLQLAVRGNLTEQDDNESSHPQLALAEDFRIRRGRRGEPDSEDVPFVVPTNWGWVAVGDSMNMINGRAFKPEEWTTEGTPIIRIQNLNNEAAPFNYCKIVIDTKVHVHNGDFLISWSGTPGTSFGAFIWNRGFAYLNQHIFRCELVEGVFQMEFLRLAVNARLDEMISHAQGAVGLRHITKGKLEGIRLPLPPLAEQKRIVTKVDELMALCDRLEAQHQERDTRHAALASASLVRFVEAPTLANLDFLFHNSYTIAPADLRKSILTLAVQGKLVPQDPNDDPASASIDQVSKEAKKAIRDGIIRRYGLDDPVDESELTELPLGWCWSRLAEVTRPVPYAIKRGPFGSAIRKDMFVPKGYKVYEQQHAISGDFTRGRYYITEEKFEELRAFELHPNEILVSCSGTVGKVAIVPATIERGVINQALLKLSLHESALSNEYFLILFPAYFMETETLTDLQGTAQKNIPGMEVLKKMPFPLPPLAEQRRIVVKVDQLMALVGQLETQLTASRATAEKLMEAVVAELITQD